MQVRAQIEEPRGRRGPRVDRNEPQRIDAARPAFSARGIAGQRDAREALVAARQDHLAPPLVVRDGRRSHPCAVQSIGDRGAEEDLGGIADVQGGQVRAAEGDAAHDAVDVRDHRPDQQGGDVRRRADRPDHAQGKPEGALQVGRGAQVDDAVAAILVAGVRSGSAPAAQGAGGRIEHDRVEAVGVARAGIGGAVGDEQRAGVVADHRGSRQGVEGEVDIAAGRLASEMAEKARDAQRVYRSRVIGVVRIGVRDQQPLARGIDGQAGREEETGGLGPRRVRAEGRRQERGRGGKAAGPEAKGERDGAG